MSQVVIRVSLLSGRYHAHPWGEAQHAMGGPEWPPSPWRLLRAIAACWFAAAQPPCSADERDGLLKALGRAGAPRIWIPKASFSELPCYQPLTKDKVVNSRVLHFDHFAVVADPDIYFVFEVSLTDQQRLFLSRILSTARYLGRAESRASFELVAPGWQKTDSHHEARPAGEQKRESGTIRRYVLVTTTEFRASDLWQVRVSGRKGQSRNKSTDQQSDEEHHPVHLVEALIAAKRPVPDGTSWMQYELPRAAIVNELPRKVHARPSPARQPVAEVTFRLFRRVPIPIADTVVLARDFRDQAVRAYERAVGGNCVLLSGREDDGSVARGHRHAYYLPRPARPGGFLEHFVVTLPGGETGVEQDVLDALLGVTRLVRHDTYPVLVVPEDVSAQPVSPSAPCWRSLTPFVGARQHRQSREQTEPLQQLLDALRASVKSEAGLPTVCRTEVRPVRVHSYDGTRDGWHGQFTRRAGSLCTIEFSQPINLPVALGADAHFGLGQVEPA